MIRHFAIFVVNLYCRIFYRHRVYGKEHFPKGGGLITPNHTSFLDPPIVGISCPGEVHFLGRDSLFRNRFFGWLIRNLNTHPVKRGKGNVQAFKTMLELVNGGNKVVIFPEGRRSPGGELLPGQLGVGMLIQRTQCQVLPIYIHGAYEIWSKGQKLPKLFGRTACVIGSPIPYSADIGEKKEGQQAIVNQIMERIAGLKEWYLAGACGTPP